MDWLKWKRRFSISSWWLMWYQYTWPALTFFNDCQCFSMYFNLLHFLTLHCTGSLSYLPSPVPQINRSSSSSTMQNLSRRCTACFFPRRYRCGPTTDRHIGTHTPYTCIHTPYTLVYTRSHLSGCSPGSRWTWHWGRNKPASAVATHTQCTATGRGVYFKALNRIFFIIR